MDFMSFLVTTDTSICNEKALLVVFIIARFVLSLIRILVPIALIVLGSIDIGKAVIAGDEKKIKEAQKPFVKRIIAAVIVFLIPWLVDVVMNLIDKNNQYNKCWNKANEHSISDISTITNGEK